MTQPTAPNPFEYQRPGGDQVRQVEAVRLGCGGLRELLLSLPPCRGRSVAVTSLEQVSMWASKGIVFAAPEQSAGWAHPTAQG